MTKILSWFSINHKGDRDEEIQDTIRGQTQGHQGLHGYGVISIRDRKDVGNQQTTCQVLGIEDKKRSE